MNRSVRGLLCAALVAVAGIGPAVIGAPAASAFTVPFADPSAKGYIGFCDPNGNAILGGNIAANPFVWTAVSTFSPPKQYLGAGQNAEINIYQVRPDVQPDQWSGAQLTAASYWQVGKPPAAQSTTQDPSLAQEMKNFPPMLDGLYQIRMFFGRDNYGLFSTTYPAATIQVTGSTWKVVQGGTVDCKHIGKVESQEVQVGVASSSPPKPGSYSTAPAAQASTPSAIGTLPTDQAQASIAAAADTKSSSSGGGSATTVLLIVLIVVVVAAAGGGVFLWRRGRA